MKSTRPCIFVLGFIKCVTKTIHVFFQRNGYSSIYWGTGNRILALQMVMNCINGKRIFEGFDKNYTVFSDMNFMNDRVFIEGNCLLRNMHRDYPNGLFIYNTKDIDKWIKSRLSHVNSKGDRFLDRYMKIYQTSNIAEVVKRWKEYRYRFEQE